MHFANEQDKQNGRNSSLLFKLFFKIWGLMSEIHKKVRRNGFS